MKRKTLSFIVLATLLIATACAPVDSNNPAGRDRGGGDGRSASGAPVRQSDIDGMADDWWNMKYVEISYGLAEEVIRREVLPANLDPAIIEVRIYHGLSLTVGEWEAADLGSVPAVVAFGATFDEAYGVTITGELPVELSMDIDSGRASGDLGYSKAKICLPQDNRPEICVDRPPR